jgi:hypothetical protein
MSAHTLPLQPCSLSKVNVIWILYCHFAHYLSLIKLVLRIKRPKKGNTSITKDQKKYIEELHNFCLSHNTVPCFKIRWIGCVAQWGNEK